MIRPTQSKPNVSCVQFLIKFALPLLKALFVSITVALGITLVTILQNEDFSFVKSGLYAIVAFIVDFVFSNIFEK